MFACALVLLTGCSTPYLKNRARDAADIFTVAAGVGAGGKARLGPIQAGLVYQNDSLGLRNGAGFAARPRLKIQSDAPGGWEFLVLYFGGEQSNRSDPVVERRKDFDTICMFVPTGWWETDSLQTVAPHYLTQLEVTAGAGLGVRVGFNPLELVDFVLGWTTLDLFKDDVPKPTAPSP